MSEKDVGPAYYLDDGAHVLITGVTGAGKKYGGKSSTANWWMDTAVSTGTVDLGVFVDPKNKESTVGYKARTPADVVKHVKAGRRRIHFSPDGNVQEAHGWLVDFLERSPASERILLVHDEAAFLDDDVLHYSVAQLGNESNIRSLVITQRPWDLPERVTEACTLKVWVGPVTPEAERYFNALGLSAALDDVRARAKPYRWAVLDGGAHVETNAPVQERYA